MMSSDQCLGQLRSHITGKMKAQSGIEMLKAKGKGARVTQACLKEHLICAWKDNFLCVCLPVSPDSLFFWQFKRIPKTFPDSHGNLSQLSNLQNQYQVLLHQCYCPNQMLPLLFDLQYGCCIQMRFKQIF